MDWKSLRRTLLVVSVSIAIVAFNCAVVKNASSIEKYPSRSIELVTGVGVGGGGDVFNRILAKYFEKYLKVPFVPVNKPGPAQMPAASYLAKSRPDGYTIGQIGNQIMLAELTGIVSGYKMEELRPVCQLTSVGLVLIVPSDSPWKTFQDFVDYAKKNPGTKYAHHGVGSGPYQRMELLNRHAKLGLSGVPFNGEGEVLKMILGKHVPIGPVNPTTAKTQAAAGTVRILFSFEDPKHDELPPSTPYQKGIYGNAIPNLTTRTYLFVPKSTPEDIVQTIEETYVKIAKDPDYVAECKKSATVLNYIDGNSLKKDVMADTMRQYRAGLEILGELKK